MRPEGPIFRVERWSCLWSLVALTKDRVGQTCLVLAEETHNKFAAVLELLWETQERLTSKRGATENEKKERLP